MDPYGPGGLGWGGPGEWGLVPAAGPGFPGGPGSSGTGFGGFFESCFYLCCCCLLQDCCGLLVGHAGLGGPPPPLLTVCRTYPPRHTVLGLNIRRRTRLVHSGCWKSLGTVYILVKIFVLVLEIIVRSLT